MPAAICNLFWRCLKWAYPSDRWKSENICAVNIVHNIGRRFWITDFGGVLKIHEQSIICERVYSRNENFLLANSRPGVDYILQHKISIR